eukprot:c19296_g1_i2.p1 GENE.c19296_g1_i2~~c19296_g1_i2.p1  ORF type:complete len:823 (+),score=383.09 c19296_g1_i2:27-2471(+)
MSTEKIHHIYICYRSSTDADIAEKICDKLQNHHVPNEPSLRIKCFFDKQDLKGEVSENDYSVHIQQSCLFIPLITDSALTPIRNLKENEIDPMVQQIEFALNAHRTGEIVVIPFLIGTVLNGMYKQFSSFGGPWPQQMVSPISQTSIGSVISELFSLQGIFVDPNDILPKLDVTKEKLGSVIWPRYRGQWKDLTQIDQNREQLLLETVGWRAEPDRWIEVEMADYENNSAVIRASVGKVTASNSEQGKLFVMVQGFEYVGLFSNVDLERISHNNQELFYERKLERPENVSPAFVKLKWVRENPIVEGESEKKTVNQIIGIEIVLKPSHSQSSQIERVFFDAKEVKFNSKEVISDIVFKEKKPIKSNSTNQNESDFFYSPYEEVSDKILTKGKFLPNGDENIITAKSDFKTKGEGTIRIKQTGQVIANQVSRRSDDSFEISFNILNLIDEKNVCILELSAEWQYALDNGKNEAKSWNKIQNENIFTLSGPPFPLLLAPGAVSEKLTIRVFIKAPGRENASSCFNWSRSWLARLGPVNIRLTFEEKNGNISTHVFQFCNGEIPFSKKESKDKLFAFVDDLQKYERYALRCSFRTENLSDTTNADQELFEVRVPGRCFTPKVSDLRYFAYQGLKSENNSEIEWESSSEENFSWKGYMLVDKNCRRVYAVKFVLQTLHTMSISYLKLPLYGDITSETAELSYSQEVSPQSVLDGFNPSDNQDVIVVSEDVPKLQVIQNPTKRAFLYQDKVKQLENENNENKENKNKLESNLVKNTEDNNVVNVVVNSNDLLVEVKNYVDKKFNELHLKLNDLEKKVSN